MRSSFADRVAAEISRARQKHGNMASPHEAYAVILEELDEFWDEVRADAHKSPEGRTATVDELVQVAAMCQRAAEDLYRDCLSWSDVPAHEVAAHEHEKQFAWGPPPVPDARTGMGIVYAPQSLLDAGAKAMADARGEGEEG